VLQYLLHNVVVTVEHTRKFQLHDLRSTGTSVSKLPPDAALMQPSPSDSNILLTMASKSVEAAAAPERAVVDGFHHPYTPYDVQLQFMRVAYDVLSRGEGEVGILESPTGTVSTFVTPTLAKHPTTVAFALHLRA
jgi:hypothetical protein